MGSQSVRLRCGRCGVTCKPPAITPLNLGKFAFTMCAPARRRHRQERGPTPKRRGEGEGRGAGRPKDGKGRQPQIATWADSQRRVASSPAFEICYTVETAYKVYVCPRGNLLYCRPYYWFRLKGSYVVARIFFLLLLNCSAWPCLGPA